MIYFDNSATTQALPEVVDTYDKVSKRVWGIHQVFITLVSRLLTC